MKLRVFVDPSSTYHFIEIDTDNLDISCISKDTGHVFVNKPVDLTKYTDYIPSVFISDLIVDLFDRN